MALFQDLPDEERRRRPALLHAVGKLQVVAGQYGPAQRDFEEVATSVSDPNAEEPRHFTTPTRLPLSNGSGRRP